MKLRAILLISVVSLTSTFASVSYASKCDYGGLQDVLRNSADKLHSGNPVRYIDFANDARFGDALARMRNVGVSESTVQSAWAVAIKELCGTKAERITKADLGQTQTLSGLMKLLGI
ncbi:MAG: hypothetical protein ACXVLQ_10755 [Bacteriovorax sp.]